MHLLQILFFSGLAALAGLLFAWWIQSRDHRARVRELERGMTEKVEERYRAYVELQERVTRVIQHFDRCESEFAVRLAERNDAIHDLERALDNYQGKSTAFVPVQRIVVEPKEREPKRGLDEELRAFEEKLARVQQAKEEEIERQSRTIGDLTDRIRQLEPLDQALVERGAELADSRRAFADLDRRQKEELTKLRAEIEDSRRALAELEARHEEETSNLRGRIQDLEPLQGALATKTRRLEGIQAELQLVSMDKDREAREFSGLARDLEDRRAATMAELEAERARGRERDEHNRVVEAELREFQGRCAQLHDSLTRAVAELAAADARCRELDEVVNRTHRVLADKDEEARMLRDELARGQEALVHLGLERDARHQELGDVRARGKERESHWESALLELEQRSRAIEVELHAEREGHASVAAQLREAEALFTAREAARAEDVSLLVSRIESLEPLRERLATARREVTAGKKDLQRVSEECDGLKRAAAQLEAEHDALGREHDAVKHELARRGNELAALRGDFESLRESLAHVEGELDASRRAYERSEEARTRRESEHEAWRSRSEAAQRAAEERVGELERALATESQQSASLESRVERLDERLREREAELAERVERSRALEVELEAERARVRAQAERASAAEGLVEEAARSLERQGRRIDDLSTALDTARGEIAHKEALVAERDSNLGAASTVVNELKPMLDFLERHLKSSHPTR